MASSLRTHPEGQIVRIEFVGDNGYPRLESSLLDALDHELADLFNSADCSALVLHGNDACFAVGADISQVSSLHGVEALDYARRGQLLFEKISHGPKPVVAAIAGYCMGGAWDLVLACQSRLSTPGAVFRHPGPTMGILTGWGGTQRIPRTLGRARSLEILLQGRPVEAREALELGLVDELVEKEALVSRALDRAHELATLYNHGSIEPKERSA